MKKYITRTIGIITFIGILVFILHFLSIMFIPNSEIASEIYNGFYELKENEIDVEFVGDSSIYRGITPLEMYNQDGIAGYNLALTGARIKSVYTFFKESLKYQKPKIIVMNTEFLYLTKPQNKNLDKINIQYETGFFGKIKNVILNKKDLKTIDEKIKYIFPIFEFHSRWNEASVEDISKVIKKKHYVNKGFIPSNLERPYHYNVRNYYHTDVNNYKIPEKNYIYFEKFINLCRENNIKILFITIPHPGIWTKERTNMMTSLAEKHDFKYLEITPEDIKLDFLHDTKDAGNHLNTKGAIKLSKHVSKYLKNNFDLPDRRMDKKYDYWKYDYIKYQKNISKVPRKLKMAEQKSTAKSKEVKIIQDEINNKKKER